MIHVEILSRHRDVVERFRVDADRASIGRAYDNDVVLTDPFVAPHHVRIRRVDDARFEVEDQGTANGLAGPDGKRVASATVDGDAVLRIGHTLFRVRAEDYPVEAERPLLPPDAHSRTAAVLALAIVGFAVAETWLHQTDDARASAYVLPLLAFAALLLAWTTGWALVSRIFAGAARFATHLAIALAGVLVLELYVTTTGLLDYALSAKTLVELGYVGVWSIVGLTAFVHLRAIGPRNLATKLGVVTALAVMGVGAQTLLHADLRRATGEEARAVEAWPPAFRLAPPQPAERFYGDVDALLPALEAARQEPADAESRWLPFDE